MNNHLIIMALEQEAQGVFEPKNINICYTGIGKVNAAYMLSKELVKRKQKGNMPNLVINFGTAGSQKYKSGELVACNTFVQRDMDVTGLGFQIGETPFEDVPLAIKHDSYFHWLDHGKCGSGDNFTSSGSELECDVVDMEAYALAKICHMERIPFACIKYITDGADESAGEDWNENVKKASKLFIDAYNKFCNS